MDKSLVEQIENALYGADGYVYLSADGHKVEATSAPCSKNGMKYHVVVCVNGVYGGEYLELDNEIGKKFYQLRKKQLMTKGEYLAYTAIHGKREANRVRKAAVYQCRVPYFRDGRAFALHLKKHCQSVEVMS